MKRVALPLHKPQVVLETSECSKGFIFLIREAKPILAVIVGPSKQRQERILSGASRGGTALLTPWFWPRDAAFGLLVFRTVRESISAVESYQVWDSWLQQW